MLDFGDGGFFFFFFLFFSEKFLDKPYNFSRKPVESNNRRITFVYYIASITFDEGASWLFQETIVPTSSISELLKGKFLEFSLEKYLSPFVSRMVDARTIFVCLEGSTSLWSITIYDKTPRIPIDEDVRSCRRK